MRDFCLEAEAHELLSEFDSAYNVAWETAQDIQKYIDDRYDGNTEQFLFDVAQSCDYFSLSPILKEFLNDNTKI